MKIFRIRRYDGKKGFSNYYWHADVIASSKQAAINAAKQNRVINWRCVDKFDEASEDYCYYEFLCEVYDKDAKNPLKPLTKKEKAAFDLRLREQAKLNARDKKEKEQRQKELKLAKEEYKKAKDRLYKAKLDIKIADGCECGTCKRCMGM